MTGRFEDDLNKAYEAFKEDHDSLRASLMDSLAGHRRRAGLSGGFESLRCLVGSVIMAGKTRKVVAAAVIIFGGLIGAYWLTNSIGRAGVALGDVLEHIRNSSYTFELGVVTEEGASETVKAMVLEPGKTRMDVSGGPGEMSSIVDMTAGKALILFHKQKAAMIQTPGTEGYREAAGLLGLTMQPVEELWNLRDGREERLGRKDIDGRSAEGFRVVQEDEHLRHEITVWADARTGVPVLVEMVLSPRDDLSKSVTFTMSRFDLDVELDEGLFSVEVPAGYTVAYHLGLDELEVRAKSTDEARKVERVVELWADGKKDEAVEGLLAIDWSKQMVFARESYFFSLTEKEYISLNMEDQQRVMKEVMEVSRQVRGIAREIVSRGQAASSGGDYAAGERHFEAVRKFGELLSVGSERMLITRMVGRAVRRMGLDKLKGLYEQTGQQQKLQEVEGQIEQVDAETEQLKRSLGG